jgi:hypothetical protein
LRKLPAVANTPNLTPARRGDGHDIARRAECNSGKHVRRAAKVDVKPR